MKKAILFDLDGTLLNTLTDIADSVNEVLEKYHFPTHQLDDYKYFIGNGIEVLAKKALPSSISENEFKTLLAQIKATYFKNQNHKTAPYEGIVEMLKQIEQLNFKIAIFSNKPHDFVEPTVKHYFPDNTFDFMFGSRDGFPKKPDPKVTQHILNLLELQAEDCYFIGDTATDILTGKNANIETIGVLWGFRNRNELSEAGADFIVQKPSEIIDIINK